MLHGADTTIKNSCGKTAKQIAEERGYTEILKILNGEGMYFLVIIKYISSSFKILQVES